MPPLFPAMALVDAGVNDVYVGEPALTDPSSSRLGSFVLDDVVVFDGTAAPGLHQAVIEPLVTPDQNGPDAAEAMIRLQHSPPQPAMRSHVSGALPRSSGFE